MTQLGTGLIHFLAGIFAGFSWNEGATIVAAFGAAAIAAVIAVIGYGHQRRAERRAERATLYGHSIAAGEDYLEGPYRIRRRDDTAESRFALTSAISDTKTAISLHQALVEMHAPNAVSDAYNAFVAAAQREAGPQMTAAWNTHPITADEQVPAGKAYDRSASDEARAALIITMKADLGSLD
jgi:hypothetical protein